MPRSPAEPLPPPARVAVARVLRPHGLAGDVVVEVLTDRPERLAAGSNLLLSHPGRGVAQAVRVATSRDHPSGRRLTLTGHVGRDAAEALRGAYLEIERGDLAEPPAGAFYPHDLVDSRCRDRVAGDLGVITELVANGGGLLLVIEKDQQQLLVPFVEAFVDRIDSAAHTIDLNLPEGLLATCVSRS